MPHVPAAWNRHGGESLGGPPETLGGAAPTDQNFVMLHHVPGGEDRPDNVEPQEEDAPPGVSPIGFSIAIGQMNADSVTATGMVDQGSIAQGFGAVGAMSQGQPSPEGIGGPSTSSGPGPAGNPGTGGTPGASAGDSSTEGGQARGGLISGSEAEHRITAQKGEYIVREIAVKKYGVPFMNALNRGAIKVHTHARYVYAHTNGRAPEPITGKARKNHTLMRGD